MTDDHAHLFHASEIPASESHETKPEGSVMIDSFSTFSNAVRRRFDELAKESLFVVDRDRDAIWDRYLSAFPAGSNPMFRKRTEHDCSCCRSFVRNVGNVVAIQNGAVSTVWDLSGLPDRYQMVADAMAAHIRALAVRDIFLTKIAQHGNAISRELMDGRAHEWHHFAAVAPSRFVSSACDEKRGEARTTHAVLMRGFTELKPDAVSTVADLIEGNALYRGQEFQRQVLAFQQLQARFLALNSEDSRVLLAWTLIGEPVARFRNTVIGTLVQDLSEGTDLDAAVRMYESKVAPQNYRRPTALITKGMVQSAMKTIQELGLESALERRHARLSDVNVNSVLFVDNAVRGRLKGGVEDLLMEEVRPTKIDLSRAEEIGIDDFIGSVLPRTRSVNLYLDNGLAQNFVSLTAPAHLDSGSLFRWGNDFAWSYEGNVADSIRERVKRAGGKVEGVAMRVSLAWHNTDDLDLHIREPNGNHIYYGAKGEPRLGGYLDVDMNVGYNLVRDAVENIRWLSHPRDGKYMVSVHNFTRREAIDVGFTVEVESHRGVETFRFERAIPAREMQPVVSIAVKGNSVQAIEPATGIVAGAASREHWGLKTLDLVRVNSIVLSPNYWTDPGVGNKHWFFILDGCANPLPTRGIYNEFLHPRFEKHRKVFEVLGDKTKCPVAAEQLSGVGFSSTRKDRVSVIAMGPKLNKAYTIAF